MTFLQRLLAADNSLSPEEDRFWQTQYSVITNAGIRVDADSALKVSTAWACTRLIAESVAMLPRIVYERTGERSKERAKNHPLYSLLHDQPNRRQTSFEFVDLLTTDALLRGNGYAKIVPGPRGPVDRLIPIHPDRVTVEEIDDDAVRYKVKERDGIVRTYNDDEIFHVRGYSRDGVTGVSVITYARESLGLSLAAERFGAKLFSNFSRPGGFLKHPGSLSEPAQARLRNQMETMTSGENLHKLGVLEEGMEFQPVSFTPEDSQMLQTREFQAEDVCRWFRVPPHMVGLTSKSTSWGSGIEEMSRGFVTYVLMPWLVRWQQMISKDLIIASEKYFVEFLTEALLRGDIAKRYSAYAIGRQWGWLSTNEIRNGENLNPIDGGDDDYLTPLNMERSTSEDAIEEPAQPGGAHYQQLLHESAARVARKELAAMNRAARRDRSEWARAVEDFYSTHADFVAQTMCVSVETAEAYAESGRNELIERGPSALGDWESRHVSELINLVMEEA